MAAKKAPAKKMAAPAKAAPKKMKSSDATVAGRNLSPAAQKAMRERNKVGGGFGENTTGGLAKTAGNYIKQKTGKTLSGQEQLKALNQWDATNSAKGLSKKQAAEFDKVMRQAFARIVLPQYGKKYQ